MEPEISDDEYQIFLMRLEKVIDSGKFTELLKKKGLLN